MLNRGLKLKLETPRLRIQILNGTKKNRLALADLLADAEVQEEWKKSGLWREDLLEHLLREWPKGARVWRGKIDRFMRLDLILIEKKTACLIGHLPLSWNELDHSLEIGYFLLGAWRGQGFAREAVRAVLAWAAEHKSPPIVYSWAEEKNRASRMLLRDLGFQASPKTEIDGRVQRCYSLDLMA